MSAENPLWGAPRIHGELLKLGFEVAQSSVAKYMVKRRRPPSQGWRTSLRNHAPNLAAMDLSIVPTIGFDLLYAFVIVRLDRRDLVWINVTAHPTAEWIARQITEAFPTPTACYGHPGQVYCTGLTMAEWPCRRLIGSMRCECVDHIIVLGETHLRRILKSYARYHNETRTHLALNKDAPLPRTVKRAGRILCRPPIGGLHHEYVRI